MKTIVVLGAGIERSKKRFDGALSLYLKNLDSVIITSGYDWKDRDLQLYISNLCKKLNSTPNIIKEHQSTTTRENAIYSKQKIDELKKEIEEVNVIASSSQVARTKRYFNRVFKNEYRLNFYATPEGLSMALENFPYEILKYLISLCPNYIDQIFTMKLRKLFSFSRSNRE